jgi:threonine/homoserine/homoserine lactone efflux protein
MVTNDILALFGAMLVLAIVPGPAVFSVIARAFSSGFLRGLYVTMGIILGDYVFIILALLGLSALAEAMGTTFIIIKYLSAVYLIWLGIKLLRSQNSAIEIEGIADSSATSNILTGLFITLGNPKAILFYLGFFPVFVNVSAVSNYDIVIILGIATLALGSVNLTYSFMAAKAKNVFKSPNAPTIINRTAGVIMVSAGALVAAKT